MHQEQQNITHSLRYGLRYSQQSQIDQNIINEYKEEDNPQRKQLDFLNVLSESQNINIKRNTNNFTKRNTDTLAQRNTDNLKDQQNMNNHQNNQQFRRQLDEQNKQLTEQQQQIPQQFIQFIQSRQINIADIVQQTSIPQLQHKSIQQNNYELSISVRQGLLLKQQFTQNLKEQIIDDIFKDQVNQRIKLNLQQDKKAELNHIISNIVVLESRQQQQQQKQIQQKYQLNLYQHKQKQNINLSGQSHKNNQNNQNNQNDKDNNDGLIIMQNQQMLGFCGYVGMNTNNVVTQNQKQPNQNYQNHLNQSTNQQQINSNNQIQYNQKQQNNPKIEQIKQQQEKQQMIRIKKTNLIKKASLQASNNLLQQIYQEQIQQNKCACIIM